MQKTTKFTSCCQSSAIDGLTFCLYCNADLSTNQFFISNQGNKNPILYQKKSLRKKNLIRLELCHEVLEKLFLPDLYKSNCSKFLNRLDVLKNNNSEEEQCLGVIIFILQENKTMASFNSPTQICDRFEVSERRVWDVIDTLKTDKYFRGCEKEEIKSADYYYPPIRNALNRIANLESINLDRKKFHYLEKAISNKCVEVNARLSHLSSTTLVAACVYICCKERCLKLSLRNISTCAQVSSTTIKRTVKAFLG